MGTLLRRHTVLFVMWIVFSVLVYWHIEMCSYIAHGHLSICPCLGRTEFVFPFAS